MGTIVDVARKIVLMDEDNCFWGVCYEDGREVVYGWVRDPDKAVTVDNVAAKPLDFMYEGFHQADELLKGQVVIIEVVLKKEWGII